MKTWVFRNSEQRNCATSVANPISLSTWALSCLERLAKTLKKFFLCGISLTSISVDGTLVTDMRFRGVVLIETFLKSQAHDTNF